jgi:hypothetical protein
VAARLTSLMGTCPTCGDTVWVPLSMGKAEPNPRGGLTLPISADLSEVHAHAEAHSWGSDADPRP